MPDSAEAFLAHAADLRANYATLRLSEADTRSYLIDPVLRLLGFSGVGQLRREVPVPATKEFLDYELLVRGEPQAIVEAKALRQAISDQHAAQCVQYASVLGIRWCFITNANPAKIYIPDKYTQQGIEDSTTFIIVVDNNGLLEASI